LLFCCCCPFAAALLWSTTVFWLIMQTEASAAGQAVVVYAANRGRSQGREGATAGKWLTECASRRAHLANLHKKSFPFLCEFLFSINRSEHLDSQTDERLLGKFIMRLDLFILVLHSFWYLRVCVFCVYSVCILCVCVYCGCLQRCLSLKRSWSARTRQAIHILWPHPVAGSPPVCLPFWMTSVLYSLLRPYPFTLFPFSSPFHSPSLRQVPLVPFPVTLFVYGALEHSYDCSCQALRQGILTPERSRVSRPSCLTKHKVSALLIYVCERVCSSQEIKCNEAHEQTKPHLFSKIAELPQVQVDIFILVAVAVVIVDAVLVVFFQNWCVR